MMPALPKIFCAIDTADIDRALHLAPLLAKAGCGIKLGLEFFSAQGPDGVRRVQEKAGDPPLFLDLKFHDIPNTVAGAVRAVSSLNIAYLNVHASGGPDMMRAAKEACAPGTKLLAVTVLTALDDPALKSVGQSGPAAEQVERLALLAQETGLDGVVCSAHETPSIRQACGPDFTLMVPGIRPAGTDSGDQKRTMSPNKAIETGADHLVIGRPITQANDPAQAVRDILSTITGR